MYVCKGLKLFMVIHKTHCNLKMQIISSRFSLEFWPLISNIPAKINFLGQCRWVSSCN